MNQLTREQFQAQLHTIFELTSGDQQAVPIELVEVTAIARRQNAVPEQPAPDGWRHDPFSLVFRGPPTPALLQRMYPLTHPEMGEIPPLFLVPVSADAQGRYYEAIFN